MKIIIVDDSVVFRMALKQALGSIDGLEVVSAFSNGQIAVDYLKNNSDIDLVTLDMEMPVLDGMGTLREIRKFNTEVPIIVFSSLTTRGAQKTIEALNCGASDFVTKDEVSGAKSVDNSIEMIKQGLVPKIEALYRAKGNGQNKVRRTQDFVAKKSFCENTIKSEERKINEIPEMTIKPRLIVMASSTGGPEALTSVFKNLNEGKNNIPILLVQHMPPVFTAKLAEMLSKVSPGYRIIEAQGNELPEFGTCYIAPGDYHMRLGSEGRIILDQREKNCFVRPAANCLFESVANHFNQKVASFVLTGMGEDGALGIEQLYEKGSYVFYQSERTCTVFGMPAAIHKRSIGSEVDLLEVAKLINTLNRRL